MNLDKIVCNCLDVTNGMIKDAVENGANTLEEVQEITGAGTVCGACIDDVQRLIDYFVAEHPQASSATIKVRPPFSTAPT